LTIITQNPVEPPAFSDDNSQSPPVTKPGRFLGATRMNEKTEPLTVEDMDAGADWETLDSRVSTAVKDIESALGEALAATRDLGQWVERLRTLSTFMRHVESGLVEVRQQLQETPFGRAAPVASVVREFRARAGRAGVSDRPVAEPDTAERPVLTALEALEDEGSAETPEAIAVADAGEPAGEAVAEAEQPTAEAGAVAQAEQPAAPAEAEPSEAAPAVAEAGADVCLEIESSEANIDLMVVERALRETPGVADVDLMDYAGKRARVRVMLKEGERPEETADPQHLAASVKERLAKLTWDNSLSVGLCEQG
jgi:hypothetical protein